nr:PP0621 family protein [Thauera linaloolentis]
MLILILVVAGIWWIQRVMARIKEKSARSRGKGKGGKAADTPERMLECAHCGVNVPESDGVRDGERFYCSAAHRLAGPRAD